MRKLSIIIVNYNVCYFLEQALKSVQNSIKQLDVEVIVVDNNSVDGSVEMLEKDFPWVKVIANNDNRGFSKANNQGIKIAQGEHILLLNPDTVLEETTLTKCMEFMDDHPDAGGLGIKMVDGKGKFLPESKRGLPTPWIAFYKIFGFAKFFPKSKKFGGYHLGYLNNEETHSVDVLSGAFMIIRKSVIDQIGGLDEDYFMYGEDIDLSYRITELGYKNYYYPEARIIHYKGESTKRTSINYVFIFYKAMIIFARKHFSQKNAKYFSTLINIAIYLKAGMEIFKRFLIRISLPVLDGLMIFGGIFFLKNYWEINHKYVDNYYPWTFMGIAVPIYIVFWLISLKAVGGYDKPVKTSNIFKGVVLGTILISATSNFFNDYRFSRALILLGGAWSFFSITLSRLGLHLIKHKNLQLGSEKIKRIAVIGSEAESNRVVALIKKSLPDANTVGFINDSKPQGEGISYLGNMQQLDEVINIYGINELVFCAQDISSSETIQTMIATQRKDLEYKIVPTASDYVIGSSSNLSQGDFYSVNIAMNLHKANYQRSKRSFDIASAILLLLISPLAMWLTEKPLKFVGNCLKVLIGQMTWVGFSNKDQASLPKLRKGIISPSSHLRSKEFDGKIAGRLDLLYARDYQVSNDLILLMKAFKQLGN